MIRNLILKKSQAADTSIHRNLDILKNNNIEQISPTNQLYRKSIPFLDCVMLYECFLHRIQTISIWNRRL